MAAEISTDESRKIMAVATDVRPDENIHHDPALSPVPLSRGRPVTAEESLRILTLAANVRPFENVGADECEIEGED